MSVVAVRKNKDGIEISADSICVYHGSTQTKNIAKLIKVEDITFGGAGYARELEWFRIFCKTHKPNANTTEGILDFMAEYEQWVNKKFDIKKIENEYLIVFGGKVYHFVQYQCNEVEDYHCIGAGMDFALSALYLGHTTEKAIEVACHHSVYCEKPIKTIKIQN